MKYSFGFVFILFTVYISCTESQHNDCATISAENEKLKDSLATLQQFSKVKPEAIAEVEKMNIVYRGVDNPVKIAVPNSLKFSVMAPGLKNNGNGDFVLRPQTGKEVTFKIIADMRDGKQLQFEKVFRIEDIGSGKIAVNNTKHQEDFIKLTKDEIKESQFSVYVNNYLPYEMNTVESFSVITPKGKNISVKGSKFSKEAINTLNSLQSGDTLYISNIKGMKYTGAYICKIAPLGIEIL